MTMGCREDVEWRQGDTGGALNLTINSLAEALAFSVLLVTKSDQMLE